MEIPEIFVETCNKYIINFYEKFNFFSPVAFFMYISVFYIFLNILSKMKHFSLKLALTRELGKIILQYVLITFF